MLQIAVSIIKGPNLSKIGAAINLLLNFKEYSGATYLSRYSYVVCD